MPFYAGSIGVVLTFRVTENGGPVDLSVAQSIILLVGGLSLPCTIPTSSSQNPTYTTMGGEGFPKGNQHAQLRIVFDPAHVYNSSFFQMSIR